MSITTIQALRCYIKDNSGFSQCTVNNVIRSLGYPLYGSEELKALSTKLENCAEHGANINISGFVHINETVTFYWENQEDIVSHMENTAQELGTDIFSMVQGFGVFRNTENPTPSQIGKALWGTFRRKSEYEALYNVFAWYALEEFAQTWYRYLEDNPAFYAELSV